MDFHDKSQIYSDLTKAYKNVRLASNVETGAEVGVSPETPDKLAPQRCQPAQKPQIDVGRSSKASAAKALVVKLRTSHPVGAMIAPDLNCLYSFECCISVIFSRCYLFIRICSQNGKEKKLIELCAKR